MDQDPVQSLPNNVGPSYGQYSFDGHFTPPQMQVAAPPVPVSQIHQQRKRSGRAKLACESCRWRKSKCDEERPSCTQCVNWNTGCMYKDPPPRPEKIMVAVELQKLENVYRRCDHLFELMDTMFWGLNKAGILPTEESLEQSTASTPS